MRCVLFRSFHCCNRRARSGRRCCCSDARRQAGPTRDLLARRNALLASALALSLAACAPGAPELFEQAPVVTPASPVGVSLELLAPPRQKVDVAVYSFPDLTGKNEPNDNVAVFSRAVTQGGLGFLVDSLQRAGTGKWFTVIDRGNLNDLLQERQLIRQTRIEFDKDAAKPLPPIRFAGLLLEGGDHRL